MIIVGAGLSGLIAAHVFPNARIAELEPVPRQSHNALLRFRSDAVSLITGIPFKRVRVNKGIWFGGKFHQPDIRLANQYSRKVVGSFMDRSIWDVSSVDRFVAPQNFYDLLLEQVGPRIDWGCHSATLVNGREPVVSTIPLPAAAHDWLDNNVSVVFKRAPIVVERFCIHECDLNQTIYIPDPSTSTYRVSITGDTMIVESMDEDRRLSAEQAAMMFGMQGAFIEPLNRVSQSYGKIVPIDNKLRKEMIHRLSVERNVYSVGRFATWRNILLDDVVKDLRIVKGMIEQNSVYDNKLKSF